MDLLLYAFSQINWAAVILTAILSGIVGYTLTWLTFKSRR
jgi:hypothetical protein